MKQRKRRKKDVFSEHTSPMEAVNADPDGSYTGVAQRNYETPVQDADDL